MTSTAAPLNRSHDAPPPAGGAIALAAAATELPTTGAVEGAGMSEGLAAGDAPEWIQLTPSGTFRGADGRGPYTIVDADAVVQASGGAELPIDENHATDLAVPRGDASPARGWMTELQSRQGAIWARVAWTRAGAELVRDRAYRFISPVFLHGPDGAVMRILRASLVNNPNLTGMAALNAAHAAHQEQTMTAQDASQNTSLASRLRSALDLGADANEDRILEAVTAATRAPALHAATLSTIAQAAGLNPGADAATIHAGVTALQARSANGGAQGGVPDVVKALQTELADAAAQLNALKAEHATRDATQFIDAAIAARTVGVKPLRDHYIARMARSTEDAAAVRREISALPTLDGSAAPFTPPADGSVALNAADQLVAAQLGIPAEKFAETKKALAS